MSEPETLPADVHPEAALLPWYANGTLNEGERQTVMGHLASCADCRRELDELTHVKSQLTPWYQSQPGPSAQLAHSVFAKVAQEAQARRAVPQTSEAWLDRLDRWCRSLFMPQWVPMLATTLIVAQLGLLMWLTMPPIQPEEITTRSIGSSTVTFKVTFEERATEQDIRAMLAAIDGRMIDGPDAAHAYIVQANAADANVAEKKLALIRKRTDVVRTVEPLTR